ncbi:hypothetical protein GGH91_004096, partial [Coemansia sp. RSA 2671]
MDVLNQYGSGVSDDDGESSDGGATQAYAKPVVRQYNIDTAPDISGYAPSTHELTAYVGHSQREIRYNMPYEVLAQPLAGPTDSEGDFASHTRGTRGGGLAEAHAVDEVSFRQQERMFRQHGIANDPSNTSGEARMVVGSNSSNAGIANNRGLRRKAKGNSSIVNGEGAYQGPWAGYEDDTKGVAAGPSAEQLAEYEQRTVQNTDKTAGTGPGPSKAAKSKRGNAAGYDEGQAERTT